MIKPLILWVLFATHLFVSCRKTDIPSVDITSINTQTVEGKFFGLHRTPSIEESAITAFVRGRNSQTHFIEETVKRIGYPRWDKMMKAKTGNTMLIKGNSTKGPTSSANTTSYDTYYIPFVKDSQNHVNATMVISTTPNDTSLNYMGDWQYRNRSYGSPKVDTSAERYAMFFMMMDNRTFGHTEFDIIDSRLFARSNSNSNPKKVGFVKINGGTKSDIKVTDLVSSVCYDAYICATPYTCQSTCDYRNCPADVNSPYHCTYVTLCWDYFYSSSSGGISWSLLSGVTGISGGGGTGVVGTGNPSNLPELPCEGEPSQASKPNQPAYSTIRANNTPCGSSGWVPSVGKGLAENLATNTELGLNLGYDEKNWLVNHPEEAVFINEFLQENLNLDPIDEYNSPLSPPDEAKLAVKMTLAAAMNNLISGPYDDTHWNIISPYIPNGQSTPNIPPHWWALIKMGSALYKSVYITKTAFQIYLEISKENIHTSLDIMGLLPGIGEIADLTNGIIYTVQGDGVNATLSFLATVPVAGWSFTTTKHAGKTIDAVNGGKSTLLWSKKSDGSIYFGNNKSQLPKVIMLAKGDKRIAHHIIPLEHLNHDVVQAAAKGTNPFHVNEPFNGIALSASTHAGAQSGHPAFNTRVVQKLDEIRDNNPNITPELAR